MSMTVTPLRRTTSRKSGGYRPFTLVLDLESPRILVSVRGRPVVADTDRARSPGNRARPDARRLITLGNSRASCLLPAVLELLHSAGFSLPRLEEKRRGRLRLTEDLGARLVLLLWAMTPIQKPSRAALVQSGIMSMVEEEVYYWYAKSEGQPPGDGGQQRQNTLKALRILLAGE